jgi:hypothetical protein
MKMQNSLKKTDFDNYFKIDRYPNSNSEKKVGVAFRDLQRGT